MRIIYTLLIFLGLALNAKIYAQCASNANIYTFSYNNKQYKVVKQLKNWTNAASCAVSLGGYLVEINDQTEQDSVYNAIVNGANVASNYTSVIDGGGIAYVWIGATDQNVEGTWLWDGNGDNSGVNFWTGQGSAGANNGVPVGGLYNNWGGSSVGPPKEPDNFNNIQDGGAIALAGWPASSPGLLGVTAEWNDINQANALYFVIEYNCMFSFGNITATACDSYTSPSGKIWTVSNTYLDTIPNTSGCDSIITVNLTINNSYNTALSPVVCDSYTSPGGQVWTMSGNYLDTLPTVAGCDSVFTINLTVNTTNSATLNETACDTYTSPGGKIWTVSNTYFDTISTAAGCDSLLTINLTILHSSVSAISETACDSYTSPSGKIWTTTNIYQDTIPNAAGCDSVITIDLTIVQSSGVSITETACKSYTSPSGEVWDVSGTYVDTIPNTLGCDSIIIINLTIIAPDTSVTQSGITLTANATGVAYQWLDCNDNNKPLSGQVNQVYTPSVSGNYAVEITQNNCIDTSSCHLVIGVGIVENTFGSTLTAFPNPTRGKVTIALSNPNIPVSISVRDITGKLVQFHRFGAGAVVEIDMAGKKGVYLFEIRSDSGETEILRIVLE